jgi:hypothetical protein
MPKSPAKTTSVIRGDLWEISSMRRAFILLVLLVTACEGSFVRPEDYGRKVEINKSYEARDTCLKQHAVDGTAGIDATTVASTAAHACQSETDRLITAANPDRDSKVTASIRQDTEFRAMKYVLQARGLRSNETGSDQVSQSTVTRPAD